jgi:hypothetical protein
VVRQDIVPGLHRYAWHEIAPGALQVPLPSQLEEATDCEFPLMQLASLQTVPDGHFRQAPAPSHIPSVPQVDLAVAVQSLL